MIALTTKPSWNVSRGVDAVAERLDDVAHHRVVAVGVRLVGDREDPAGVGVGLLGRGSRPARSMKARSGVDVMSSTIRPRVAVDLEAVSRPPLDDHETSIVATRPSSKRTSMTALSSPVVLSPWTEGRAPGEHVADRHVLAEQVAGRLDAVRAPCPGARRRRPARHPRSAAACGPLWPSRARNVVRRPIAPASTISRIRTVSTREDDVLEVAVEDAGLARRGGASRRPRRRSARAAWCRRRPCRGAAAARTASRWRWFGSDDDDEVDLGVGADGRRSSRSARLPKRSANAVAPLRPGAAVGRRPGRPGRSAGPSVWNSPMNPDPSIPMRTSRRPSVAALGRAGRRRRDRREPRPCAPGSRRGSSPSRSRRPGSRPRAMTSSSASSVRTPPAALTWTCGEVLARIRRRSSWVAPLGANPVEVLTKSPPAASVRWQARTFSSSVR